MKQLCLLLVMLAAFGVGRAQTANPEFEKEFSAAKGFFFQHNYPDASKHFKKANKLQQDACSDCYIWLARIELSSGENNNALKYADRAFAAATTDRQKANAQLYRGAIFNRLAAKNKEKLADAEAAFRAAATVNPQCTECRLDVGMMLLKQGKQTEGVEALKAVLPEYQGSPKAREIARFISDPGRAAMDVAPDFSAQSRAGKEVNLDVLQGKVVLLDFWGSWCPPCRDSVPALRKLADKFDPASVVILSIDEGDAEEQWATFLDKNHMNWPQIRDANGEIGDAYAVDTFPHYFVLSKTGIIVKKFDGWSSGLEVDLKKAIEKALKE